MADDFSVLIEVRAPAAADLDTDAALAELLDRLDEQGLSPAVSGDARQWSARIFVQADDAADAAYRARPRVVMSARAAGLPTAPVVRAEAVREDVFDEDLARPQLPELVSGPEAAEIAGVSLQRWHQLVAANLDRLEPAIERPHATLWFRAGVVKFASERRRPGRPRKDSAA